MAATATTERCRNVRVNIEMLLAQTVQSAASNYLRNAPAANLGNAMFYMNAHSARKWYPVTTGIPAQCLRSGVSSMRPVLCGLLHWFCDAPPTVPQLVAPNPRTRE